MVAKIAIPARSRKFISSRPDHTKGTHRAVFTINHYLYPRENRIKPYKFKMRKKSYLLLAVGLLSVTALSAQVRREFLLEKGWKFTREDDSSAVRPAFDDSRWQTVIVPHDWAIYGPFNPNNDKQNVAIVQDGQVAPSEHAGRTGGLPFVGTGWYRTKFECAGVWRETG